MTDKTKTDSPALVRHDARIWMRKQSNEIIVNLTELIIRAVRNLQDDPNNNDLRCSLRDAIKQLGAATNRSRAIMGRERA